MLARTVSDDPDTSALNDQSCGMPAANAATAARAAAKLWALYGSHCTVQLT